MRTRYYRPRHQSAAEQQAAAGGCGCLLLGFLILAAFGSCVGGTTSSPDTTQAPGSSVYPESGSGGAYGSDPNQPPVADPCSYPPPVYDGYSCFPGGEQVKVTRVIDGDTVELADRRVVRLLGVDAPEANSCAGPGAMNFTRGKVEGRWVFLHRESSVTVDKYNRELAYVLAESSLQGHYSDDLGYELTSNGWAEPFSESDANATYDENVQRVYETATHQPDGMFAPPCGNPEPYNVPNYDYPNPSPGDGDDGESRLCRGRWYC